MKQCPFCYQPMYELAHTWICLHIEGSPRTHFFDPNPSQIGPRGISLVQYLERHGKLTIKQYRELRERAKDM